MPEPEKNWKTITRSQFPWEQEALDFIYDQFPAQDNYRAWANFEFIADDGSINEVDLLVAGPRAYFLSSSRASPVIFLETPGTGSGIMRVGERLTRIRFS